MGLTLAAVDVWYGPHFKDYCGRPRGKLPSTWLCIGSLDRKIPLATLKFRDIPLEHVMFGCFLDPDFPVLALLRRPQE